MNTTKNINDPAIKLGMLLDLAVAFPNAWLDEDTIGQAFFFFIFVRIGGVR